MIKIIFLLSSTFLFIRFSYANINKCILADKVSREFTLAAVKGDIDSSWKLMKPSGELRKDKKKFEVEIKRQFKSLSGKTIFHSVSTNGLERADCNIDTDKIRKFRDHRLLLHFDFKKGNGMAKILPMSVEVHFVKGNGWYVDRFASTSL